ncbi:MAG: cytochrome C oxidase subunit IV family protein [Pirellulales bacterium]
MTNNFPDDAALAHDDAHHGSYSTYYAVAILLVILTACSYATFTPMWTSIVGDNVAVKRAWMMAVSCSKAMLVILFFMHLLWEANWKWILTIPASGMSIFLALALVPDVGWRQNTGFAEYSPERLLYAAEPTPQEPAGRLIEELHQEWNQAERQEAQGH